MDNITQLKRRLHYLDNIVKKNLGYIEKRSEDSPEKYYNHVKSLTIVNFYFEMEKLDWFKGITESKFKKIISPYIDSKYKSMIMKRWEDYMSSKGKN